MGFFKKLKKKITWKNVGKAATGLGAASLIHNATKAGKTGDPNFDFAKQYPGMVRVNDILASGGKGTWLDPAGDPAENAAFGEAWGRMGRNRELSAVNATSIDSPDDPYATGFARTKARIASGSDMAKAFSDYKLGQSQRRGAALTGLQGAQYGQEWGELQDRRSGDREDNEVRRNRNAQLWGSAGDLFGKGVSAFFGGGG